MADKRKTEPEPPLGDEPKGSGREVRAAAENAGPAESPGGKASNAPARKRPFMGLVLDDEGRLELTPSGDFSRLMEAVGDPYVVSRLGVQIAFLGSPDKRIDESASNFVLGFVDSMKPRDPAETLLLTQLATVHEAAMMMARRLNHSENIPQQDSAERAFNKLARTYTAQLEALKRYRSKGQQTVRVERVNVESGGQAVVGNVTHGGRGNDKT